jgi:hypothetical protein
VYHILYNCYIKKVWDGKNLLQIIRLGNIIVGKNL